MAERRHISWKTKCAAAVFELDWLRMIHFGPGVDGTEIEFFHAKEMTEDQYLSLWHWDHNKLHAFDGGDHFTNLRPMPIKKHREKTKVDAKVVAKSRRIRKRLELSVTEMADAVSAGLREGTRAAYERLGRDDKYAGGYERIWGKRKIASRSFDKTRKRKMDGTVVKR